MGHTTDGTGTGSFTSSITVLNDGVEYFVRAYVTNENGIGYGENKQFTTTAITLPEVTTKEITDITINSAKSGGNVTNNGNGTITTRGVCWDTTSNPTLENSFGHTISGSGLGEFVSTLTDLSSNIQYYVKAYATNSKGTAYGNEKTFVTLSEITLPTVITNDAINITDTSATSGGNVADDGGDFIIARGVCWSTSNNPSLSDNYTEDGSGAGAFISEITGLTYNTTYYVRAYATNSVGSSYGNEINFSTLSPPWQCGDTIIYSAQTYNTILIGAQCWMKENINVGIRINGTQDQTDNSIVEKYCYDDDEANCNEYGGLYQWNEMMQYMTEEGVQGICPLGWHIPTDEEWKVLEGTVDSQYGVGDAEWDKSNVYRGYDAGKHLKSTSGWYSNGNGTDEFGFKALPGGDLDINNDFGGMVSFGYWWSSMVSGSVNAWSRILGYSSDKVYREASDKTNGRSVRCIKD